MLEIGAGANSTRLFTQVLLSGRSLAGGTFYLSRRAILGGFGGRDCTPQKLVSPRQYAFSVAAGSGCALTGPNAPFNWVHDFHTFTIINFTPYGSR